MFDLSKLLVFAANFSAVVQIQAYPERCLNARHPGAACTRCADICPTDALTVTNRSVSLNEAACIRCGACLWACPSGAFVEDHPSESRLAACLQQHPGETIELVCPAARAADDHAAEAQSVITGRCLVALSPALLIHFAAGRTLWLHDTACTNCLLGSLYPLIAAAADRATAWLSLYNRGDQVLLLSQYPAMQGDNAKAPIDGTRSIVDRRAFLRGGMRGPTLPDIQTTTIDVPNPVNERLDYWLPQERNRLLEQEVQWPPPPNQMIAPAALGLAGIEIQESSCTLCGWCAGFCPTAALELHTENDRLSITFRPLRCLDCNICVAACPADSVGKRDAIPYGAVRQSVLMVEDERQSCTQCGNNTAKTVGELCIWCQQKQATDANLQASLFEHLRDQSSC